MGILAVNITPRIQKMAHSKYIVCCLVNTESFCVCISQVVMYLLHVSAFSVRTACCFLNFFNSYMKSVSQVCNWRCSHANVNGSFVQRNLKQSQVTQSDKFKQYADDSLL